MSHSRRCYEPSPKLDDPSHSVLYLCNGTLTQNEVGISLKLGEAELEKNSKFGKTYTERGFGNVIDDFSFLSIHGLRK